MLKCKHSKFFATFFPAIFFFHLFHPIPSSITRLTFIFPHFFFTTSLFSISVQIQNKYETCLFLECGFMSQLHYFNMCILYWRSRLLFTIQCSFPFTYVAWCWISYFICFHNHFHMYCISKFKDLTKNFINDVDIDEEEGKYEALNALNWMPRHHYQMIPIHLWYY